MKVARPIGVFDSGVGGLTVVRALARALPHEDIVYLGDTARVPYGTKSPTAVVRFACEDTEFLLKQKVKAVVVACNTASAWALPTLQQRYSLPIFGVIYPGVRAALEKSHTRRIGVIGTRATVRSAAYQRGLEAECPSVRVFSQACPLLVPLVEEGWSRHTVTRAILRLYLAPLKRQRIDTLILGCTHYPLLKTLLRQVAGKTIGLVDSAESCARYVQEQLAERRLLNPQRKKGTIRPFLTDETERFDSWAERFLGRPTAPAKKIELTPLPS